MTQIFYPKFALFICLYAIIFTLVGTTIAKIFDKIFPEHDESKHKFVILIEFLIQICVNCVFIYALREYVHHFMKMIPLFKNEIFGNPGKFAALIISPTIFTVQTNLAYKLEYIWL